MFLMLLIFAISLVCLLDYYKRRYWIKKGVFQTPSIPFFGHYFQYFKMKVTSFEVYDKAYHEAEDEPYVGVYEFWRPALVLRDLKLIEHILIKDFSHFLDHPRWIFDDKSFVHESLFNMKGDKWRALRYQMIPWFTTGRLRELLPQILPYVEFPEGVEFDGMEEARRIGRDTISAFLGVQVGNKEAFTEMNKVLHDVNWFRFYRLMIVEHFSSFSERLGIKFLDNIPDLYFRNYGKIVLSNKDYSLVQRSQKLIENKEVKMRKKDLYTKTTDDEVFTFAVTEDMMNNIIGQFLVGGLDTTTNTITWILYELAVNPETQKIAREEIRRTLAKHGGWSYDALLEMRYVINIVHEATRLHPALPFLFRMCTSTYTTPDGFTIEKGTKLIIPALSVHKNPEIYEDPELFKPERFGLQDKQTNIKWLPFGEGPRKCTGIRMAQLVMRTVVGRLLENYAVYLNEDTQIPMPPHKKAFLNRPMDYPKFRVERVP